MTTTAAVVLDTETAAQLRMRPIEPEDAPALLRFHHRLSLATTRLRFFTVHPELSERELNYFTHVDHEDRDALVAVDGDEVRAVARYDRISSDCVEFAVVVEDAWQGRGIGSDLFCRIAALARTRGFRHMCAETLLENHRMLAVFRSSGLPMTTTYRGGVVTVMLDLDGLAAEALRHQ